MATLSFDYRASTLWIDHLTDQADPANHDLCAQHADRMAAPMGWDQIDRRVVTPLYRAAEAS